MGGPSDATRVGTAGSELRGDTRLACLAVSSIKGCEACVKSHEAVVREKGLKEEAVLASVRLALVVTRAAAVTRVTVRSHSIPPRRLSSQ